MKPRFECQIIIRIACPTCATVLELTNTRAGPYHDYPAPLLPDGWNILNGWPYCPKHVFTDVANPYALGMPEPFTHEIEP